MPSAVTGFRMSFMTFSLPMPSGSASSSSFAPPDHDYGGIVAEAPVLLVHGLLRVIDLGDGAVDQVEPALEREWIFEVMIVRPELAERADLLCLARDLAVGRRDQIAHAVGAEEDRFDELYPLVAVAFQDRRGAALGLDEAVGEIFGLVPLRSVVRDARIQGYEAIAATEDESVVLRQDRPEHREQEVFADHVGESACHRVREKVDLAEDAPPDLHESAVD